MTILSCYTFVFSIRVFVLVQYFYPTIPLLFDYSSLFGCSQPLEAQSLGLAKL